VGAQIPVGPVFQVNEHTTGEQHSPTVVATGDGGFAVIWQSSGQDGDGEAIVGRRFDRAGTPVGEEFIVNDDSVGDQVSPHAAAAPDGSFIVAWTGVGGVGGNASFTKIFAPDGEAVGPSSFSGPPGDQRATDVAASGDGEFAVVWELPEGSYFARSSGVFRRRFALNGQSLDGPTELPSGEGARRFSTAAAALGSGNFLVAWGARRRENFPGRFGFSTQTFGASPEPLTPELPLVTWDFDVARPAADANAAGDAVVIAGFDNTQGFSGIVTRRFTASGEPAGSTTFRHFPSPGGLVRAADASIAQGGTAAFVWDTWNIDFAPTGSNVLGNLEGLAGEPIGGSFVVNQNRIDGYQGAPSVAWTDLGEFVVVFQSYSTSSSNRDFDAGDGGGSGIFAQRFNATPASPATHTPTPTITPSPSITPTPTITPTASPAPPILCRGRQVTILGTRGDDVLRGTSGDDVIDGRGGHDRIYGRDGGDTICGGGGKDLLVGGSGNDILDGGGGRDRLKGGAGDDVLRGGAGDDACRGEEDADTFRSCETIRDG
jgi:Ca2+-binding RTX toxin-like protein